jgi:hypothetical protein
METQLIQRGTPGYSKQQKQLRDASTVPTAPVSQVASTIGGKQYNAGGGTINPYNAPITSSSLAPAPKVNLPTQTIPTAPATAQGTVNATLANNNQQQAQIDQKNQQDQSGADLLNVFKSDVQGVQDEITSSQTSIDRTAQEAERLNANRIANEIEAEQNATRQQVDQLRRTNPQGSFGGALEDQIQDIERESLIRQTNKAILLNAANRNFEALKEAADSALALKLEPLKLKLENTKLFYQENKDIFNKADDRAYQEKIKEQDREYKKVEAIETQITDLKKNVAQYAGSNAQTILSQLAKIDTSKPDAVDKALKIAGEYGGDVLDRRIKSLQANKLIADIAKTRSETIGGQSINVSSVQSSPYKPALDVILGSTKFTKDQKASFVNAVNNGQDPFAVIKNQAISILGTEGKEVRNLEQAKAQIDVIDGLLKDYYSKGGKTNVFRGSYEKTLNKLGTLEDPELVSIGVNVASALQTYRNAVSGTAYSVKEGQEIESVFPGIKNSKGLNDAIIKGRKQSFDTNIDAAYKSALGDTYDDLKRVQVDPLGVTTTKKSAANDPLGIN